MGYKYLLSILICTLESRKELFDKICYELNKQILDNNLKDEVELIYFSDSKEYPVGMKRNILIQNSQGTFVCFVDDDDNISPDYIKLLYNALKENPDVDCVGFKGLLVSNDLGNKEFIHSVKYDTYNEDVKFYYRPPNHLNPIRKDLIKNIKFPIVSFGEDTTWSKTIAQNKILKNEIFIDQVLYYYNFEYSKSQTHPTEVGGYNESK